MSLDPTTLENSQSGSTSAELGEVDIFNPQKQDIVEAMPTQDDTPPSQEEEDSLDTSEKSEPSTSNDERKREEVYKKILIDELEERFTMFASHQITADQLKAWIDKRGLHETADRSKRVKEDYRDFMKSFAQTSPATAKTEIPEDFDSVLDQKLDAKIQERIQKQEEFKRDETAKLYAQEFKFQDKEYESLVKNAAALQSTNPTWSYTDSLQAAHRVLRPTRQNIPLPPGVNAPHLQNTDEKVDLSQQGFSINIMPN